MRFWSAIIRALLIVAILAFVALAVWDTVFPYGKPIDEMQALDGCFEGEGLPDIIRPPRHWTFTIRNGVVGDRFGHAVAKLSLGPSEATNTPVAFSPGIMMTVKPTNLLVGKTVAGKAYVRRGLVRIALADDLGTVVQKTSCS